MTTPETNETAANIAEQGAHGAPQKGSPNKGATRKKAAPKAKKNAKAAASKKPAKKASKTERTGGNKRSETKGDKILELIRRSQGATLAEIMKITEWQAHSVRGFISTAGKKYKVHIESSKNEAGNRVYRIAK